MEGDSMREWSAAVEAASRLRHDLAKYIRFSAAGALEADTGVLRERLRTDVLTTRRSDSGVLSAAAVFDEWQQVEGRHFPRGGALAARVAAIAGAIDEIRTLGRRIETLDRPELERLDQLTRTVVEQCRALDREAKAEGPRL
jgi:hypothetical protein